MAKRHKPQIYCGGCPAFVNEDSNGYGFCNLQDLKRDNERFCGNTCRFLQQPVTRSEAVRVLHHLQKYRRGSIPSRQLIHPYIIGLAIDVAIHELRKNRQDEDKHNDKDM